jgi:putative salt-induced outer membrane protein YdiY
MLVVASWAGADEVLLKNGERVIGTIEMLDGGKLTIKSDSFGTVKIDFDKVKTFSTSKAVPVHFKDGTVVSQQVQTGDEGTVRIEKTGVLEPQTLPMSDITKINPPPVKWTGDLTAGLAITRGNSETQSFNTELNAIRRSDDDRITFGAGYRSAKQTDQDTGDEETTERYLFGKLQYDYFFTKKFYGYANARAEKDALADLALRFVAGAGVGYQWAESETFNLSTEGGLSWFTESYTDETPREDHISLRLAYHIDGKVNDAVKLFHDLEWYPSTEDAQDHFITAQWGIRSALTKALFAELKVVWNWDSTPASGSERQDVRYLMSAGLTF